MPFPELALPTFAPVLTVVWFTVRGGCLTEGDDSVPPHQAAPVWLTRWGFAMLQSIQMDYLLATVEL